MGTNTIKLKDIAAILGVSVSTVSKALNNSIDISESTKNKVLELAESLNYKPNFHASALRNNRSLILGVLLPDLKDNFFLDSLNGITEESIKNDYKIMVYQSCNDYNKEITYANLLADSNIIDGLIFSSTKNIIIHKKEENHINNFITKGVPVIYINKQKKSSVNSTYKESGFKIGKECVKELLSKIEHTNLSA
ncbi:LacI family DNA-binding transcriptional regulator [uncultured Lacinutrix sp.]|uniref:LacI family DNA-binding transcriptional regulator n=1 Tax=uncultured Lacinutrix sp. TaxID=574032 RepID=UPI002622C233|nr:LacI family DNA-binding transcriptional regulator [uncultured Lacinutrix sp.]